MIKEEGGLRIKGQTKSSYSEKPLITVATVVYNGQDYLEETILSIINQKYKNLEFIIIDGGSTDNTLEIIKKYEQSIDYWVSEKDEGIYDAMNKANKFANGKWINFMNCGDSFCNDDVINKIKFNNFSEYVMIYGNTRLFNGERNFLKQLKAYKMSKLNLLLFITGVVCHQAVFYNRGINFKFPDQYKFKGELYSYFEYLNHGKAMRLDLDICNFFLGGTGKKQLKKNNEEMWSVLKDHTGIMRFLHFPMNLILKFRYYK